MIFPRIKVLNITKIFETIILRGTQHWLRSFSSQFPTSPTLYNFLWQPDMCVLVLWSSQTSNILRGMWETNPWCCCKSVPSEHSWNIQNWSYIFFKHVFVSVIMIEILPRESTPFLLFFGAGKWGPGFMLDGIIMFLVSKFCTWVGILTGNIFGWSDFWKWRKINPSIVVEKKYIYQQQNKNRGKPYEYHTLPTGHLKNLGFWDTTIQHGCFAALWKEYRSRGPKT